MATTHSKTHSADGTPVWISGDGPTVILAHGVLMDHRMWGPQVEALSEQYRVCCFDMLGHGEAPDPPGERMLDDFVGQLHDVVQLVCDEEPSVLCGFSMGGLVSQAYAIEHHSDLSGLMLLNTVYDRTPEQTMRVRERFEGNLSIGVENAVESGRRRWFKERDRATRADAIEEILGWIGDGDFAAKSKAHRVFVSAGSEVVGRLGVISCPALVMTGEEDDGSTPDMARKMVAEMPNAQLEIVAEQHHMMPVLDAAGVNAILLGFLPQCWKA